MNSQRLWVCTVMNRATSDIVTVKEKEVSTSLHPQPRSYHLHLITTHKGKKWYSPMKLYWICKPLFRAGPMRSSSWPTQNEPGGVFVGSFSHNALSGFCPPTGLFIYIMSPGFLVFWDFYVWEHVCPYIYMFLMFFSLTTFFCLFVSS